MEKHGLPDTDLSLPAGSLQCALRAFEGGADSVYLGMKSFSARKGAVNFSFEDLRKLKQVCLDKGKKFYVTLNTLVKDSDMPEVESLLRHLDYIEPDGVIVQDLGIARLIRKHHPALPLHASTQLAAHTVSGVRQLEEMGFERVVLSRELSLQEIREIRQACPDVELKVFIHGALCFGFSGLCMASEALTGRSANCGECAQICRSWFSCDNGPAKFWPFSMRDLCLGPDIRTLRDAGVQAFKVEGRMKSPQYVYHCARYYRALLDGDDETARAEEDAVKISFARQLTKGFFHNTKDGNRGHESLTCPDYPGHRGIEVGRIKRVLRDTAEVVFDRPLAVRDGLLVISGAESAGFPLSLHEKDRTFVSAGRLVTIDFPASAFSVKPESGTPIMCVSLHNMNMGTLQENIPMYRKPVDLDILITDTGLEINGRFFESPVSQAVSDVPAREIFEKVFRASDKSLFTCADVKVRNGSSAQRPFIPLSGLKKIRRGFYALCDEDFEKHCISTEDFRAPEAQDIPALEESEAMFRMSPVMFGEQECFDEADRILREKPGTLFGLNNIAHLKWAASHPEAKVFADSFLYIKNSLAWQEAREIVPGILGVFAKPASELPLFISRVCFRHSSLGLPCKGCSKNNTYTLRANGKTFRVECRNCITTLLSVSPYSS